MGGNILTKIIKKDDDLSFFEYKREYAYAAGTHRTTTNSEEPAVTMKLLSNDLK
jgi:hypothetical protein